VRTLAEFKIEKYQDVFRWPLAEALVAFEEKLKQDAQQGYIVEYISWNIRAQAGSKEKPPRLPDILQD
jgi:hypothetical protein